MNKKTTLKLLMQAVLEF